MSGEATTRRFLLAVGLLVSLAAPSPAHAATVSVPSAKYPTIQAAVSGVGNGDVIEVKAGTYREAVKIYADRWAGKSLTLRSTAGRAAIINAAGLNDSALIITGGTVRVEGFTFTGGAGHVFGVSNPDQHVGGGVVVSRTPDGPTSATFEGCAIQENSVPGAESNGGGAFVSQGARTVFQACDISNNDAGRLGGGAVVDGGATAEFIGGSISDNASGISSAGGAGGGLFIN